MSGFDLLDILAQAAGSDGADPLKHLRRVAYLPYLLVAVVIGVVVVRLVLRRGAGGGGGLLGGLRPKLGRLDPVPIDAARLPRLVKRYFDEQSKHLERLDYPFVGDFKLVHGPQPIFSRFHAADGGVEFGQVSVVRRGSGGAALRRLDNSGDIRTLSIVSVFEDGTCLETSDLVVPASDRTPPPQWLYHFLPGRTADELLLDHRRCAADYAEKHKTTAVAYPADQVVEVAEYYAAYQREHMQSQGWIAAPRKRGSNSGMFTAPDSINRRAAPSRIGVGHS